MKIKWKYIILFIVLALGLSFPVQQGYLSPYFKSIAGNTFLSGSGYLLAGFSTLVAAIITLTFHTNLSSRITIFGDNQVKNTLILSLPIIAFSISGLNNNMGINNWLYGFGYALVNTVYAFAEEYGWRRYLQNALEGLNKNIKYLFIGVIWWIWHFRFSSQFDIFVFPAICIGGGFLLGKLTDDLKSILPAIAMHTLIIITTNSGNFGSHELLGIGIVVLGWIIIEQIWKKRKAFHNNHDDEAF